MKKYLSIISLLVFSIALNAQYAQTKMKVSETEHDFGKFKEEAGSRLMISLLRMPELIRWLYKM